VTAPDAPRSHPFRTRPHHTLVVLTVPVLFSLLLEPLTGLVDTFFIARLGAASLGALGISTTLLSSVIWVFNFVGIGAQTQVARFLGADQPDRAAESAFLAIAVAYGLGILLALGFWGLAGSAADWMGAHDGMQREAVAYLRIRLLGAPAVLGTLACFGSLRGLQDMRTPLWVALGSNLLNLALDPLLIFGAGPVPPLGVAGAAIASTVAHWVAALWAYRKVRSRLGRPRAIPWRRAPALLVVGRDLVFRTGLLLLFQLLATRKAAAIGVSAIAAHHATRQLWLLCAFLLDAYAASAQSLTGYFLGARDLAQARRVGGVSYAWGFGTGVALALIMLALEDAVAAGFVPLEARADFHAAWLALALFQPVNALSFVSDGLLWGASDYTYMRNVMFLATAGGVIGLSVVDTSSAHALAMVWAWTGAWMMVRAVFGTARLWPGLGRSPFRD